MADYRVAWFTKPHFLIIKKDDDGVCYTWGSHRGTWVMNQNCEHAFYGFDTDYYGIDEEDALKEIEDYKRLYMQGKDIDKAKQIAYEAHKGQVDKAGKPYTEHLEFVASKVDSPEEKCVAYLHDVMEDTEYPPEKLKADFSDEIYNALCAMTHKPCEDYFEYIARVAKNPLARAVKKADLTHNMMIERLDNPTENDYMRLEKYKRAYKLLCE